MAKFILPQSMRVGSQTYTGTVKVGTGINVGADGTISVTAAGSGGTPMDSISGTTAATAGWYRFATSPASIGMNGSRFAIEWTGTGVKGRALFNAHIMDGADPDLQQVAFSSSNTSIGLSQVRLVYNTTASGNYAYLELYNQTALAVTINIDSMNATGWTLMDPSTAGSIPASPTGYTSVAISFDEGYVTNGVVTASQIVSGSQLKSTVTTGTAPLIVASTTKVTNLNADLLDGFNSDTTATVNTIALRDASANLTAHVLVSNVTTGTAPLTVSSTTAVTNLNADMVDGFNAQIANGNNTVAVRGASGDLAATTFTSSVATGTAPLTVASSTKVANLNADKLDDMDTATAATATTIVARDASGNITGNVLVAGVANGTAPLTITSTTKVNNLNVDQVDGYHASATATAGYIPVYDGSINLTANQLKSTVTTGTAPLTVSSTTVVTNLNADQVDGFHAQIANGNSTVAVRGTGGDLAATTFTSSATTGTAPLTVASTTAVANLNADMVDGKHSTAFMLLDGTQSMTADMNMGSHKITNVVDPVSAQDAATKNYVDSLAAGIDVRASVKYATTADLGTVTYNNGTNGVGATLTLTTAIVASDSRFDGGSPAVNDRILVKNQGGGASHLQNGIYVVTSTTVLTRASDADNSPANEVTSGMFTFVEQGSANADTGWMLVTDGTITLGTTALSFTQFTGAGSFNAGTGLSQSGNTINLDISGTAALGGVMVTGGNGLSYNTGTGALSHDTSAGSKHIPSGGAAGQFLGYGAASGTASWATPTLVGLSDTTISSPATANYLRYNGSAWVNAAMSSSDVTTALTFTPANKAGDTFTGGVTFNAGLTLPSGQTATFTGTLVSSYISNGTIVGATSDLNGNSFATAIAAPSGTAIDPFGVMTGGSTSAVKAFTVSKANVVATKNNTLDNGSGNMSIAGTLSVTGATSLGSATATTPSTSDNSTKIATTAWVMAQSYATSSTTASGYGITDALTKATDTSEVSVGTSSTTVTSWTPSTAGNRIVFVYFRVITADTALEIDINYTDASGAQVQTVVASSPVTSVGSYSIAPIYINTTATAISVTATAGVASQAYVSASIISF